MSNSGKDLNLTLSVTEVRGQVPCGALQGDGETTLAAAGVGVRLQRHSGWGRTRSPMEVIRIFQVRDEGGSDWGW